MKPIFLGMPIEAVAFPLGAANALFLAPLGGLGADVCALAEAYARVAPPEENVARRFADELNRYRQAVGRENWGEADAAQMELSDIVGFTEDPLWRKILKDVRRKNGWALRGGFFATAQNPVTAFTAVARGGEKARVLAGNLDNASASLYRQMADRNRQMRTSPLPGFDSEIEGGARLWADHVFHRDFGGLPTSKATLETLRRAKVALLAGKNTEAFFLLMERAAVCRWHHESETLLELASQCEARIGRKKIGMWYVRLGGLLALLERRFGMRELTGPEKDGYDLKELRTVALAVLVSAYPSVKDRYDLKELRTLYDAMGGDPAREGISGLLKKTSGCRDFLQSVLRPVLSLFYHALARSAGENILAHVDRLRELVEIAFDAGRRKSGALRRLEGIQGNIEEGDRRAVLLSLGELKRAAAQEGADEVVGGVNALEEVVQSTLAGRKKGE